MVLTPHYIVWWKCNGRPRCWANQWRLWYELNRLALYRAMEERRSWWAQVYTSHVWRVWNLHLNVPPSYGFVLLWHDQKWRIVGMSSGIASFETNWIYLDWNIPLQSSNAYFKMSVRTSAVLTTLAVFSRRCSPTAASAKRWRRDLSGSW